MSGAQVAAWDGGCLPLSDRTAVADLPAGYEGNIFHIDYRVPRDTRATVLGDGRRAEVPLRAGRDRVYLPAAAASGPGRISVQDDGVCLRAVVLGMAVPEEAVSGGAG
ncbi:hypothetical protein OG884_23660 [Streptosporangium sp. NBC_01755]|uniref:hypothetical protein n=1 Tax=unclassified Streptosporangium TaxID=2632669 RepID=UPI002DD7FD0D|nr:MULTISPECIES: hypothetical protein [unclassified Streptosporangium]WSA24047.1 hypothetical protein OIE13_24265 [Streptosporangium sp. NBC_01810]WSC97881.1 hypothetical protein OG884_23660 [Streptosporangium sp. NBC_01755]